MSSSMCVFVCAGIVYGAIFSLNISSKPVVFFGGEQETEILLNSTRPLMMQDLAYFQIRLI